ncbi:MAG TPA: proton-conducting transporter membrane subunit [Polyangiaceae bacterium]
MLFSSGLPLILAGGVAALVLARSPAVGSALAVLGVVAGAVVGGTEAVQVLLHGSEPEVVLGWQLPYGQLRAAVDPLSAFFLMPIFGLAAIAAVYGREYMKPYHGKKPVGFAWFAFNLLVVSMAVVVTARQALLFLVAWELMSLCAYVLVTFEHEDPDVRRAGFVYLIATHVGTAFLLAMFLLLARHGGSFDFAAVQMLPMSGSLSGLLFGLALAGFGVKAGFVPFHVWLPEAHAAAPSHVSALMSGVLIKMGIYGLLRVWLLLGHPAAWWSPVLIAIGLTGGLLGISLALYQRDIKRVLAYSSIENVGLIAIGLGTASWGSISNRPQVAALGMSGALLHIWNHTLMKGLMFLGAGSVVHGSGTKDLEQLGGLMKRMPRTATTMVLAALAIAALPPMNGFVSEWLLYLGLIRGALSSTSAAGVAALLSVGLLSFIGGLTLLCFVRLVGIALLGEPRGRASAHAHESPAGMTVPMMMLAAISALVALYPHTFVAATSRVSAQLLGNVANPLMPDAPLATLGRWNGCLWLALALGTLCRVAIHRRRSITLDATWGCGYARPSPRMQYTASSFAELISARMPKILRAELSVVAPSTLFPVPARLSSACSDPLTRGVYEPFVTRWAERFARLRWLQQGVLHVYLFYILFAALVALAWSSLYDWLGR